VKIDGKKRTRKQKHGAELGGMTGRAGDSAAVALDAIPLGTDLKRGDDHEAVIGDLTGVPPSLVAAIRRRRIVNLTSVQRAVLAAECAGRDLRITSQTGSGKTIAIGFALEGDLAAGSTREAGAGHFKKRGPTVLVLVPTRELAMQVRDELGWLFEGVTGLGIEVVMGGTSVGVERRALSRGPQVVVGTPGRVLDHVKRGALALSGIKHVVLDESDRMLDMGFREELEAILDAMPTERRTHLVSATFPPSVRKLADRFQSSPLHIEGTALGAANCDIEHVAHVVSRRGSYATIVNLLLLNEGKRCLIFVERRVDVAALAEKLSADGFAVQPFSGDLAQSQRTRTINAFRHGTMKTLVSTDVAARGIDVPDIELVIHADTPESADTYIHRSGRTGRAGSTGRSVMLVSPKARRTWERLLTAARINPKWLPVSSAAKVEKELRKRFRRSIHDRLETEAPPTQEQVDYAKGLLDGRDPAAVVALLLEMAHPKSARAAMDVSLAADAGDAASSKGSRTQKRSANNDQPSDYVTFSINWGTIRGAATSRILGHICRRGQIQSQQVGAIDIQTNESLFQVHAAVAKRFEKAVVAPDPRDPGVRIVPHRGPVRSTASTSDSASCDSASSNSASGPRAPKGRPKRGPWRPPGGDKKRFKAKSKGKGRGR
jgi:ATP-dependent RNA helicase DeaD